MPSRPVATPQSGRKQPRTIDPAMFGDLLDGMLDDMRNLSPEQVARYLALGAIPEDQREAVQEQIQRVQAERGVYGDEAIDFVLATRGTRRTGAISRKPLHATVCARALQLVRERGWRPRLEDDDYERIAAAGFYLKTLPLAFVAVDILEQLQPLTVRGLLYQLVSAGWVESTSLNDYNRVDRLTITLREREVIPFDWIVDDLRVRLKPSSWSGLADYGETVRDCYRKDFWEHLPVYLEFFVEKNAMAGVLQEVTEQYDVALNPIRGMSSLSALHRVGMLWREIKKPIFAFYLGDHDPSGLAIEADARAKLERYAGRSVTWMRLAVLPSDFETFDLLRLKPKKQDPNLRRFLSQGHHDCAELDAIPANALRDRVRDAILEHIPAKQWERLRRGEEAERASLEQFWANFQAS